jgi:Cu+-exporting ATPase
MTNGSARKEAGTAAECPVCGMEVDPGTARDSVEFDGVTYSFCAPRCKDRFQARPELFLARRRAASVPPVKPGRGSCCG